VHVAAAAAAQKKATKNTRDDAAAVRELWMRSNEISFST
jgi:hypothetical protein